MGFAPAARREPAVDTTGYPLVLVVSTRRLLSALWCRKASGNEDVRLADVISRLRVAIALLTSPRYLVLLEVEAAGHISGGPGR